MNLTLFVIVSAVLVLGLLIGGWNFIFPSQEIAVLSVSRINKGDAVSKKSKEERVAEARERSRSIKGLYMTADVASDLGAGATRIRKNLIRLAEETEINGLVIDVKEVCGPDYNEENIQKLLEELHQKNIWAIARITVFKDASQIEVHPEWYLKRAYPKTAGDECFRKRHLRAKYPAAEGELRQGLEGRKTDAIFWRDRRGGYWLDPADYGARNYILEFSKKMIDLGFDELQFDYIRFPSDGDVENSIYPSWDGKTPKYSVMKSFFEFLHRNLTEYKPEIIISADLFGYAAIRSGDAGIGQRLDDIGDNFDYISFMVYPSHYYSGLYLPEDSSRGLPARNFNFSKARSNPGEVVYRSLLFARDFLDGIIATSTGSVSTSTSATTNVEITRELKPRSASRLRPWLEDFFHEDDRVAKRPFGVEKVRLQIEAAEKVEAHGWLLWNAANIYTEGALQKH